MRENISKYLIISLTTIFLMMVVCGHVSAVEVGENETADIDLDFASEGININENTVEFDLNEIATSYKNDNAYIFEYSDDNENKQITQYVNIENKYSYSLELTPNNHYSYQLIGYPISNSSLHDRPWTYANDSFENTILGGTFNTNAYGRITNFTHDNHVIISIYNNGTAVQITDIQKKPCLLYGGSIDGVSGSLTKYMELDVGNHTFEIDPVGGNSKRVEVNAHGTRIVHHTKIQKTVVYVNKPVRYIQNVKTKTKILRLTSRGICELIFTINNKYYRPIMFGKIYKMFPNALKKQYFYKFYGFKKYKRIYEWDRWKWVFTFKMSEYKKVVRVKYVKAAKTVNKVVEWDEVVRV